MCVVRPAWGEFRDGCCACVVEMESRYTRVLVELISPCRCAVVGQNSLQRLALVDDQHLDILAPLKGKCASQEVASIFDDLRGRPKTMLRVTLELLTPCTPLFENVTLRHDLFPIFVCKCYAEA